MSKTAAKIVAEIGCNHKGDMIIAKEMIQIAATYCKADYVKFQKRNNRELLTPQEYTAPHPNPQNSYGKTYGEHREFLEFNLDQNLQLMEWCKQFGIKYATSAWDVTSAKEIASLKPDYIKVPSACNLNFKLLEVLAKDYSGDIHISFGMTNQKEEQQIIGFLEELGAAKRTVIYSCTSGYPVAFQDVCLLEINRLIQQYSTRIKQVGFSGHHLGISVDIAAITLGAEWVERHFTLDRTWKGTDHAASLEPDGMRRLGRDIRNVTLALSHKSTEILPVEEVQRNKLKASSVKCF